MGFHLDRPCNNGVLMEPTCDSCEMKRLGFSLSISLQNPTGHTCEACKNRRPSCSSCKSERVRAEGDFGYDFISCLDCGYTIESVAILEKIPERLRGVISEEAMAFYDAPENRETKIWIVNV